MAPTSPSGWRSTAPTSTGRTPDTNTIGRANLNGTRPNQSFISLPAGGSALGVAVDAGVGACAGREATIVGTGRADRLKGTKGGDDQLRGGGEGGELRAAVGRMRVAAAAAPTASVAAERQRAVSPEGAVCSRPDEGGDAGAMKWVYEFSEARASSVSCSAARAPMSPR